jgi:para-nitrobenzyl esterase
LDAEQRELSDNMIRYWTQFAKVGNPNSTGTPFCPLYNSAQDGFQSLVPPVPVTEFEFAMDHRCEFWAGLFGTGVQRGHKTSK